MGGNPVYCSKGSECAYGAQLSSPDAFLNGKVLALGGCMIWTELAISLEKSHEKHLRYIYTTYCRVACRKNRGLKILQRSYSRSIRVSKSGGKFSSKRDTPSKTRYVSKFILSNIARLLVLGPFAEPLAAAPLITPFVAASFVGILFVVAGPFADPLTAAPLGVPFVAAPFASTSCPLATPFPLINLSASSSWRKSIPLAGLSSLFPLLLLGPPAQLIGLRLLNRLVIPLPMPAALHLFLCGGGVSSRPSCCLTNGTSA